MYIIWNNKSIMLQIVFLQVQYVWGNSLPVCGGAKENLGIGVVLYTQASHNLIVWSLKKKV